MSSWSSAYPPPPPRGRSRSRSPYRGGYPRTSYPDAPYPADPYRADWDAYDRDRAWASYERERAAYEYGRRRSRSPPPGDEGMYLSLVAALIVIQRHHRRPRYNDDHDAHSRGYGYDRGPYPPPPYASNRRGPPDPYTFDYPATLKQYAEWFRYYFPQQAMEEDNADKAAELEAGDGSKPRNGIRSRWEKYKKEFAAQQLQRMFEHHRKSPWFAEKYDPAPEFQAMRTRVRKVGWRGRMDTFVLDLESGKFDPDLNEPSPESNAAGKDNANGETTSTNGAPGAGETNAASTDESKPTAPTVGEEDMQFNVEAEEDAGDNDANRNGDRNRRPPANRGEEIAVPPEGNQVMIRTIPPDIGRAKLEESISKLPGFIYLALGDPLQKRNYYRAGWIKFSDDADMSSIMGELSEKKIEGFKLHVAHITKPFVTRVRYTPEVASKPDRMAKDLENAKKLAAILENEYVKLVKAKADEKPRKEGETGSEGDKPEPPAEDTTMGDSTADAEDPMPREMGSEAVERRIEKVMADLQEQGLVDTSDEKALEAKRTVIALDLYLAYLRAAFNTCYYCAVVTDHVEELQRKCVKHVRKPMSKMLLQEVQAEAQKAEKSVKIEDGGEAPKEKETSAKDKPAENRDWKRNDERWLEWLDSKVALLINRDGVDPRDYGGKSYEEELSRACEPYIKQEDEGKFRCKTCQKLFKATPFVEKHIANKHPDLIKNLEEIPYFNNFALDPHRIQPYAHPPQIVGTSQPPPPQAYGLQGSAYPAPPPAADYGRPPPYHAYPGYPPFPGYWDPYAFPYGAYPPPPPRDGVPGRRLSDRISGIAPGYEQPIEPPSVPASAGLPAKPAVILEPGPGVRRGRAGPGGPSPPPPPDAKEDPRAQAGKKVSYVDVDRVAEGDVELTY
ncbi:hypothetical protein BN946_scf184325.g13 [Trametes cinnabarina]|uniref:C2H2-type domain-containing protein n=1 Tax=Pycnoporus cinnabarinus TaxID=5643 RepID=A0A060SK84_PYCCI|nr:hypothetical protein BN946_scf184325.g13 [Trametes cinnabarina]